MPTTHPHRLAAAALLALLAMNTAQAIDLRAALAAAESQDARLASALATQAAAAENIGITRARLLPQVSLQNTTQALDQQSRGGGPTSPDARFSGPATNTQLAVRVGVLRPRERIGADLGERLAELGTLGLAAARSQTWLTLTELWLDLQLAEASLGAGTAAEQALADLARAEQARYNRGESTRQALAETQAQWTLGRARVSEFSGMVRARRAALGRATGLAPMVFADAARVRLDSWQPPALSAGHDDLLQAVTQYNPDLQRLLLEVQVSRLRLAQARADHWPTVDLVASATASQNDSTDSLGRRLNVGRVGVQVSVPLYTGGGLQATQRQADAGLLAAIEDHRAALQALEQRILAESDALESQRDRLLALDQLTQAASEQLRAAQAGLARGQGTSADVAQAQTQLANRQFERIAAAATWLRARARLAALLPTEHADWQRLISSVTP